MKLYIARSPNGLRVSAFLAEKGVSIPTQAVDILSKEARKPAFLAINSLGEVPVLELSDGTRITESVAICRYLEGLHPRPPLFGATPLAQARIEMWTRRTEQQIFDTIGQRALHRFEFFADKIEQVPQYADSLDRRLADRWAWLDAELSDGRPFLAPDGFSVADITGMAALFVCDILGESVPSHLVNVRRWEAIIRERPSFIEATDDGSERISHAASA
ncbi:MAG: glutathione S-transferase family protein [Devosia sp.]